MRTRILALALLCACSYSEEKPAVFLEVDNIPAQADHLDVTVTDSLGGTKQYRPSFQPGVLLPDAGTPGSGFASSCGGVPDGGANAMMLCFVAPAQNGTIRITVIAALRDQQLSQGTVTGNYTGTPLNLTVVLGQGTTGVYAAKCNPSAPACGTGLDCKSYGNSGETGVCTNTCASASNCATTTPAATCIPFRATTTSYCQWDCTGGGSCPPGLTCKPDATNAAKSYCTGI
jgi:hypothetical protein